VSRLREQAAELLRGIGIEVTAEDIRPARGFYRSSPYADCYRWEVSRMSEPNGAGGIHLGCWIPLTDFVREGRRHGIELDKRNEEVWPLGGTVKPRKTRRR
jgi:hypothetical protein